ncbi:MAG TPA: vitamin K epoxide reductase family protein [Candidatus Saccharimonadales bacterium]
MDSESARTIIYIFSAIGLLDTGYLIYHKIKGTDVACLFFPKAWCRKVQYSKQSKTFGIPNSFAGFAMYTAILVLTYLSSQGSVDFDWVKGIVAFGFAFSMYFTFVQAFILRAFCTWCVVSAINFTIMLLAAWTL